MNLSEEDVAKLKAISDKLAAIKVSLAEVDKAMKANVADLREAMKANVADLRDDLQHLRRDVRYLREDVYSFGRTSSSATPYLGDQVQLQPMYWNGGGALGGPPGFSSLATGGPPPWPCTEEDMEF